jgi:hypothetical protein
MENSSSQTVANKWLSIPIIATITRLLCRELTLQNEYIRQENKLLKSKIKKRIVFTDDERRVLVEAAMAMGRDLMEKVVRIVQPKTILVGQRKLENQKWDYSDGRKTILGDLGFLWILNKSFAGWHMKTTGDMLALKESLRS